MARKEIDVRECLAHRNPFGRNGVRAVTGMQLHRHAELVALVQRRTNPVQRSDRAVGLYVKSDLQRLRYHGHGENEALIDYCLAAMHKARYRLTGTILGRYAEPYETATGPSNRNNAANR